jgi:predicted small lipoprotein YifL
VKILRKAMALALVAFTSLVMVGCGQSGPLYLPGSTQPLPPSPSSVI